MTEATPQGTFANQTGSSLEQYINTMLHDKGYTFVEKKKFMDATYLPQPVYTRQFPIAKSIYDTQLYCDFLLYHPDKHPNCLIIESKWQQAGGSVDEKFPFLVMNIREKYPYATIIVLDGGGYKKKADEWLRKQVDNKIMHVFNMREFQIWSNGNEL